MEFLQAVMKEPPALISKSVLGNAMKSEKCSQIYNNQKKQKNVLGLEVSNKIHIL